MTAVFDVETDRRLVDARSGARYVLASIVAPEGRPMERPPVNLGLVLDRSGSMGGEKIRLSKEAAIAAVRRLAPRDRFAVVTYDDRIDIVVESTAAGARAVDAAARAIAEVEARGSTDLCGGWLRGCEQVSLQEAPGAVTRVLLLTDGLANVGIVDPGEIARHAAALRTRGVATTTIGVGEDFDEHLLGQMADEGGGHFYYVQRGDQIPAAIETEVGEALEVTLRGAVLRVGPASLAQVAPVAPYPTRREGDEWVIALGDLVSRQELSVPLRISFAPSALAGATGTSVPLTFVLRAAQGTAAEVALAWMIAGDGQVAVQDRSRKVDRAVAEAYAALARREAGRLNREGDFDGARQRLAQTAGRIQRYASDDAFLNALVKQLEQDGSEYCARMTSADRKARYMGTYGTLKSRGRMGGSTRSPRPPDTDDPGRGTSGSGT